MPKLIDIISPLLMFGSHELGHITEADKLGVERTQESIIPLKGTISSQDPIKKSRIFNAGFEMQDLLRKAINNKNYNIASALNKAGYALLRNSSGDIQQFGEVKGKQDENTLRAILLATALSDLRKAKHPEQKYNLGFGQSSKGTPMLMLNGRF